METETPLPIIDEPLEEVNVPEIRSGSLCDNFAKESVANNAAAPLS